MQCTREVLQALPTIAILLAGRPPGGAPGQSPEAYGVVKRWLEGSEFGRPVTAGLPAFEGVLTRGQAAALLAALLDRGGTADRLQEAGR